MKVFVALTGILISSCSLQKTGQWLLPDSLHESSGLVAINPHTFFSINDSGNPPAIHVLQTNNHSLDHRIMEVHEANIDWEAMAMQGDTLYIADAGNNLNKRSNLIIHCYRLLQEGKALYHLGSIPFSFEDQTAFPPAPHDQQFDCEAMVVRRDSILLFTKDRSEPFQGETQCYLLMANNLSPQQAQKLYTLSIGKGALKLHYRITGASLSENGKTLALLSTDRIRLYHIQSLKKMPELLQIIRLQKKAGREAVSFIGNNSLAVTSEKYKWWKSKLWTYQMKRRGSW